MLAGLYVLTFQTFRSDRLALGVVLVALSLPAFTACSLVMTIDAPFLCCWTWALVFGRWAMVDGKAWAWPVAGVLVALGILAKYTMALWLVSAGLFVLFTPTRRGLLWRPGFWVMALVAALSAVPILYWNSQHDWVSFRHVAVQAGVAESKKASGIRWFGPLEYVGGQLVVLLGYWFVCWVGALVRYSAAARNAGRDPVPLVDVGADVRGVRLVELPGERTTQLAGRGLPFGRGFGRWLAGRTAQPPSPAVAVPGPVCFWFHCRAGSSALRPGT